MWPFRSRTETESVTCPACGRAVDRERAREYDKYGNRWDRDGKTFEFLCRPCHDDLCHHARNDLETLLVDVGAGTHEQATFLSRYCTAVEARYGSLEEKRGP